jgi:hypothetical protein
VPAKNADHHTISAPTATGPLETQKESGARVGRVEGKDYASHNNSAAGPVLFVPPAATTPTNLISSGNQVPRVRVAESTAAPAADEITQGATISTITSASGELAEGPEADGPPDVARYPGFSMDKTTR